MKIVAGSDETLLLTLAKEVGQFQLSDYAAFEIRAYAGSNLIQTFTVAGSSIIGVSVTEDENGNYEYTLTSDTDKVLIRLVGSNTTNYTGYTIHWQIRPQLTDAEYSDGTRDSIYVKDNISIISPL